MQKPILIVMTLVAVGLLVALLFSVTNRDQEPVELSESRGGSTPETTMDTPPLENPHPVDGARVAEGERLKEIIEREVETMTDVSQLDAYLKNLERRAMDNRRVSPLEVQPGIAAIEKFSEGLGSETVTQKTEQFRERMADLSLSFDGRATASPSALIETIGRAKSDEERESLVRQFIETNPSMGPEERDEALKRFEKLIAKDSENGAPVP